nr:immunoglobulin light chain junction region [Macaca mulatta]
CLQALQTPFTC